MRRPALLAALLFTGMFTGTAFARLDPAACGTSRLKLQEQMFLHRLAMRKRAAVRAMAEPVATPAQDIGNIAIVDASGGVMVPRNQFDLDQRTLAFLPSGATADSYRFELGDPGYDASAAASGTLVKLGDDDSVAMPLPFDFPFFGSVYRQVFVNSDGNLTFTAADSASTDRSLGRMAGGAPRISPLFADLDPSQSGDAGGVHVLAEPARLVVSWVQAPAYSGGGVGARQTFQVRLYPDGRIEFAYRGISIDGAVVGIAPGASRGTNSVLSFLFDPSATYPALVAEVFSNTVGLDLQVAAQKFYRTHDDAYDYLVFYNDMNIVASAGAVAWEETVRNHRSGYGDPPVDVGAEFGSAVRLQSVLNMGYLAQYPPDPQGKVAARGLTGDTPVTLLAHEAGHLFLAYASIRDPDDAAARPMLGYQNAHWVFNFNSDASVMQGELIRDDGPGVSPEFDTVDTVSGYSPLDLYLMGFIPPAEVEPAYPNGLFLVTGVPAFYQTLLPQVGVRFDGTRRDIHIDELIGVEGRRTPDETVSQRRFRFAFVLIVAAGTQAPVAEAAQIDAYRVQFEPFYQAATGGRAFADTALRHSVHLSAFPAAGTMAGSSTTATLSVDTPPAAPLVLALTAPMGAAGVPPSSTIAAGATSASFTITGLAPGVEELSAIPNDGRYDSAYARIQVAPAASLLIATVSGGGQQVPGAGPLPQPIVVRVTDVNLLPYAGVNLQATPSGDGSVTPRTAVTDGNGAASFSWSPGAAAGAQLRIAIEGAADVSAVISAVVGSGAGPTAK